jgi:hypothetical protein
MGNLIPINPYSLKGVDQKQGALLDYSWQEKNL